MKRRGAIEMLRNARGATAVEFAMVGPIFLTVVIGMTYTCLLLFSMASMQFAVEAGARCASVQTTVCADSASTINYAKAAYYGPLTVPNFTYSATGCGHTVSSSTNFVYDFGLTSFTVPLSATACFP